MHVSDHVKAVRIIVKKFDSYVGRIVHIAPKNSTASCLDVYKIIADEMMDMGFIDKYPNVTWGNNPRPYDPPVIAVKGSNIPGWSPMSLREGLRRAIINWSKVIKNAKKVQDNIRKG
jgi:dTDP-D-glucose 4,6-dehydratase